MRIANVARDAAVQHLLGGVERAAAVIRKRAGGAFDPRIAECLADNAAEILTRDPQASAWEETLAAEPHPRLTLEGQAIDRALSAMGAFADLVSPSFVGHSTGVADLVARAADRCRLDSVERGAVRRAALVHDLGRVAVPPHIWNRPGPLSADEWEQVRLHPYQTERVLSRSPFLAALAPLAGAHHERLDGSGYHRGTTAAALSPPARLLAVADAYHAMTQPRPHRERLAPELAAEILSKEASAERLDADAVAAVLEATGQPVPRIERPGGLTEREAEVIGLLARGLQTKQIARASASRSRPPSTTSRTHTGRSASRPGRRPLYSRWSTASRHGQNSRLRMAPVARSFAPLAETTSTRAAEVFRMNALLVTVTINDREPALAVLREQIVPRASQAPGFVTGYWLVSDDNRGTSVLVFESAEAAQALARVIESEGPPTDAVALDGLEIREVAAHA